MKTEDWSKAPAIPGPKPKAAAKPPGSCRKNSSISSRRCCKPWRHCRAKRPFTVKCARCSTLPPRTGDQAGANPGRHRDREKCRRSVPGVEAQRPPGRQWLESLHQQCPVRRRLLQPHRHGEVEHVRQQADRDAIFLYRRDTTGTSLDGKNTYEITFAAGQEPPVNGFWSLTLVRRPALLPSK